jgi:hypothetical protein
MAPQTLGEVERRVARGGQPLADSDPYARHPSKRETVVRYRTVSHLTTQSLLVTRRMGGARHIRHQDRNAHRAQPIMGLTTAPGHTCHAISILTTQDTA